VNAALPSYRIRALHLTAIWAYGVAQPVFSLLQGNPEFLPIRGITRVEVMLFGLSLALLPPLVAAGCEWLVSRVSRAAGNFLHVVLVIIFLVPLGLQLAKWIDPATAGLALLVVWAVAFGGAAVYAVFRPVRLFVSFSILLPIFGMLSFVVNVPVAIGEAEVASVHPVSRPPIVFVVLDELPLSSLLTRSGEIDAGRFPNLATLARDGTWYRNATTVHDFSFDAVPAILSGRRSEVGSLPTVQEHPENIFTLLGHSYDLDVHETWTQLCPLQLCPRSIDTALESADDLYEDVGIAYLRRVVPRPLSAPVPRSFSGFDPKAVDPLLAQLADDSELESLHFAHLLLPHAPWRLLPSGRSYYFSEFAEGLEYPGGRWTRDAWLVEQAYQRHLLQLEFTDAVVGRILGELHREGTYDRALVVVVADHGASFRPGLARRNVSRETFADIAAVPLMVKYPGQGRGGPDPRRARTIDILPTIADVIGVRLPWRLEGRSLLDPPVKAGGVTIEGKDATLTVSRAALLKQLRATVRRKATLFGEGNTSLYRIGTHKRLLGLRVSGAIPRSATVRVAIQRAERFLHVHRASSTVPARMAGVVVDGELSRDTEIAVAINGRVFALTRWWWGAGGQLFRALIPESELREGHNRVDIYAVEDSPSQSRLVWLGSSAAAGS
jgi:hypothetical protein